MSDAEIKGGATGAPGQGKGEAFKKWVAENIPGGDKIFGNGGFIITGTGEQVSGKLDEGETFFGNQGKPAANAQDVSDVKKAHEAAKLHKP